MWKFGFIFWCKGKEIGVEVGEAGGVPDLVAAHAVDVVVQLGVVEFAVGPISFL